MVDGEVLQLRVLYNFTDEISCSNPTEDFIWNSTELVNISAI